MKLSVIIPCYNEENTIKEIISQVKQVKIDKEILVVDDGSKDKTREIISKIKDIRVILKEKNEGKGATIRRGIKEAKGDILIIQDADLEYDPKEYPKLIAPIVNKKTNVVYGSRFLGKKEKMGKYYWGNKILSLITSILFFSKITDMETCYKLFKRETIQSLTLYSNKFDIEPEMTSKLLKRKEKIIEIPISYNPRTEEEGKKINWKDGVQALGALLKYRFSN